jgi:hypothetical protein
MYEYIRPVFLFDEAVAFFFIEPLYGSVRHSDFSPFKKFS